MQRSKILKWAVVFAFAVIFVRLFFIQVVEHDKWVAKASEQHTLLEKIVARRGEIYMMDRGKPVPVVLNQTVYSVIIDPQVAEKEKIAEVLEKYASDKKVVDLDAVYDTEGSRYAIVAKGVPHTEASEIAEEEIPGVWFQKSNKRVYPEGELAAGLLGFVNADGLGQYGTEGSLNHLLAGTDGMLKTISDVNNIALSIGDDNVKVPAVDGENVVLTVDRGLERGVEDIAIGAINNSAAENAAVLVMDTETSEVLAMANLPNYDPANYGYVKDASAYMNYVTEVPYEPASVCKSFIFSAAINEGKMNAGTTFFNKHYDIVDGWKIENAEQRGSLYGTINMKRAFYWSLNTSSMQALRLLGDDPENITQLGRERMYDYYYNKFRLGRATGIEIMEAEGYIPDPNEGYGRDSTYANMTFGQNLGVTMIQTLTAFSAVVNGGYYRTPTILAGTMNGGNLVRQEREGVINGQILTEETSATMRDFLINNHYTAGKDGYDFGGKTGTAQVVVDGKYDNTMSELMGSYAGFVTTAGEVPKYVVMVKMWGAGQALDGTEAQKLFDDVARYIIDYFNIKPR